MWRVTYTKDGHKKLRHNRKWLDGYLRVQGRSVTLLSEEGQEVSAAKMPPGVEVSPDCDELTCFGVSILVSVDEPCGAGEGPGGVGGAAGHNAAAAAPKPALAGCAEADENAPAAANRPALPLRAGAGLGAAARPVLSAAGRRGFQPPRVSKALPTPEWQQQAERQQQAQRQQPGGYSQLPAVPQLLARQQPGPVHRGPGFAQHALLQEAPAVQQFPALAGGARATGERTDEDILSLLMGGAPVVPAATQGPPVKRAKVQQGPEDRPGQPLAARPPAAMVGASTQPGQRSKWASWDEDDGAAGPSNVRQQPQAAALQRVSKWGAQTTACDDDLADDPIKRLAQPAGPARASKWGSQPAAAGRQPLPNGPAAAEATEAFDQHMDYGLAELIEDPTEGCGGFVGDANLEDRPALSAASTWHAARYHPAGSQAAAAGAGADAGGGGISAWTQEQEQHGVPQLPSQQQQQQQQQQLLAASRRRQLAPPTSRWALPAQQAQQNNSQQGGPAGLEPATGFQRPRGLPQPGPSKPAGSGAGAGAGARSVPAPGQLHFPSSEQGSRLARRVVIPEAFGSGGEYALKWKEALMEELNLRLWEVAQSYHSASQRLAAGRQPPSGTALEGKLRQCGVQYHGDCELFIWKNLGKKQQGGGKKGWKRWKGRAADADEDVEEDEDVSKKPESLYLILKGGRGKSADYRKDDLWVISSSLQFQSGLAPGQVGDKARAPWVAIARSLWHGPNNDGKFEIELLTPRPPTLGRSQQVVAIKGPDASTELSMMQLLEQISPQALPLLPHILGRPAAATAAATGAAATATASGAVATATGAVGGALGTPPRAAQEGSYAGQGGGGGGASDSPSYSPSPLSSQASEGAGSPSESPSGAAGRAGAAAGAAASGGDADGCADGGFSDDFLQQQPRNQARRGRCKGRSGISQPAGPGGRHGEGAGEASASEDAEGIIAQFGLNQEQADVVRQVAGWCQAGEQAAAQPGPPICLIHGPFGSGKSTLLVALLRLLLLQRSKAGSPFEGSRVLVSAHTNVAVDRVLLGLLESGCTDFLRVGPLRRLSRGLLRQSLHCSESRTTATAAAELKAMLKEASDPHEQAVLRAELELAEKGAERQKKRLLKTVPIVGVTCCSALLSALDGQQFDVVILDECSQMVEPLSMVPLMRARCKHLIAAGDPLQLPPVIASPSAVTPPPGVPPGAAQGLLRPLFVRLAQLGHTPHLLRRQYRCHPDLSAVPNQQFYGGRLLDGCTREQRASLLAGLPNLVFLDVRGSEQYSNPGSRSAANPQEASAVVGAVQRLLEAGVKPGQIGVICFFRAQVTLIRSLLNQHLPAWLEAQRAQQAQHQLSEPSEQSPEAPAALPPARRQRSRHSRDLWGLEAEEGEEGDTGREEEKGGGSGDKREAAGDVGIQVATVDSFQGAERDVIILSTTVTRPGTFAADSCRLNVALTRAKHNLVLVGCSPALQQSAPTFATLLRKCRSTPGSYSPHGRLPLPVAAAGAGTVLPPAAAGAGVLQRAEGAAAAAGGGVCPPAGASFPQQPPMPGMALGGGWAPGGSGAAAAAATGEAVRPGVGIVAAGLEVGPGGCSFEELGGECEEEWEAALQVAGAAAGPDPSLATSGPSKGEAAGVPLEPHPSQQGQCKEGSVPLQQPPQQQAQGRVGSAPPQQQGGEGEEEEEFPLRQRRRRLRQEGSQQQRQPNQQQHQPACGSQWAKAGPAPEEDAKGDADSSWEARWGAAAGPSPPLAQQPQEQEQSQEGSPVEVELQGISGAAQPPMGQQGDVVMGDAAAAWGDGESEVDPQPCPAQGPLHYHQHPQQQSQQEPQLDPPLQERLPSPPRPQLSPGPTGASVGGVGSSQPHAGWAAGWAAEYDPQPQWQQPCQHEGAQHAHHEGAEQQCRPAPSAAALEAVGDAEGDADWEEEWSSEGNPPSQQQQGHQQQLQQGQRQQQRQHSQQGQQQGRAPPPGCTAEGVGECAQMECDARSDSAGDLEETAQIAGAAWGEEDDGDDNTFDLL